MRTQQGVSSSVNRKRTPQEKKERQAKTLESKARARRWAERNRIRNSPITVARETTVQPLQAASRPHTRDTSHIVEDLLKRKRQLLIELNEIETAIAVIRRTS